MAMNSPPTTVIVYIYVYPPLLLQHAMLEIDGSPQAVSVKVIAKLVRSRITDDIVVDRELIPVGVRNFHS
jgi:hypothetical protein